MSLSARRAWIEIKIWYCGTSIGLSLSARRAWIEIRSGETLSALACVALRKESVDRNTLPEDPMISIDSRSPQGERG